MLSTFDIIVWCFEVAVEVINFRRCVICISPGSCNKTVYMHAILIPVFIWHNTQCQSEKNSTKSRQSWRWDSESETMSLECSIFLFYFFSACPWHLAFCLPLSTNDTLLQEMLGCQYKVVLGIVNYFIDRICSWWHSQGCWLHILSYCK